MMRGRFAPTPSGLMHIGNARTALLAWLQVRKAGGAFILRMEDIDKPRSKREYADSILDDLRWLGLDWDEGPDLNGPYAPYTQSFREELYAEAIHRLEADGWLYPCYCSRAELLSMASAPHGLDSEGPAYTGACRGLTPAEREAREYKKTPSLRFTMPDQPLDYVDHVAGVRRFASGAGGDFVVKRADGIFSYQLAVVVDDAAMGITDVLRGWDLLDSTPRQLQLFQALGLPAPRYAHVPLLHGPDGQRLSKRHGSLALSSLRSTGRKPEEVVGVLAALSGLQDRPEPAAPVELLADFDLAKVGTEPSVLTEELLRKLL